jgi:hypothetical protein
MSEPVSPEVSTEDRLREQAIANIRGMIQQCAQGVNDREADALALVADWEELRSWVTDGFARARPKKPDAEGRTWGVEVKRRKLAPQAEPKAGLPAIIVQRSRTPRLPDRQEKAGHRLHQIPCQQGERVDLPATRRMPRRVGANIRPD